MTDKKLYQALRRVEAWAAQRENRRRGAAPPPAPAAQPAGEVLLGALVTVQAIADNARDFPERRLSALEQISTTVDSALRSAGEGK